MRLFHRLFYLAVLTCAVILSSLLAGGCDKPTSTQLAKEDSFSKVKRTGVLRVGYIVAPPWITRDDKTGELSGTSIDTINEIARLMEAKLEFEEANFATFVAGLQSGKYDLSIAPIFSTIPRAKAVAFTRPLMYLGNSALVRQNETRFKTLQDIDQNGVIVAVTQGEQGHEYAKANFKKAEIKVISGADQSMTYSEVLSGRADVALGDAWFIGKFVAEHSDARDLFANNPYNTTPIAWSVRYEDLPLLTFINTSLDYLDTIGKLDEIYRKYDAKWLLPKKIWTKS